MPEGQQQLYDRQIDLNLFIPSHVAVVGCGGVGSWVAIFCAMSGVPALYLYDPDVVEESNRNRLPFCIGTIGRPKVDVVADFIRGIRPDCKVYPVQDKFTGSLIKIHFGLPTSYIIECTDSPKSQIEVFNSCKGRSTKFIRAGYDGTHVTIASSVSGWIKGDVEEENYQINPSWVVPAAMAGAMAVGKMMKYTYQDICLDIGEIGQILQPKQKKATARCYQRKADKEAEAADESSEGNPAQSTITVA